MEPSVGSVLVLILTSDRFMILLAVVDADCRSTWKGRELVACTSTRLVAAVRVVIAVPPAVYGVQLA